MLIILLTQLKSCKDWITHLVNTPSTLWLAPITAESQDLDLRFVYLVPWPIVEVVAGPGAARLGEALAPVHKLTVLLVFSRITLWVNITAEDWSNTGFFLVDRAAEVVWWAGAILGQGEDVMAAVIAGLFYR